MTPPASVAWTVVFLPAFGYFLATRMAHAGFRSFGRSYHLGQAITNRVSVGSGTDNNQYHSTIRCSDLANVFYVAENNKACITTETTTTFTYLESKYALQLVQETGLRGIVATTWRHDSELGRGYLLLSEVSGSGNIWRWEVGGGPIAIGRTLHLQQAGCRSNLVHQCPSPATDSNSSSSSNDDDSVLVGSGGIAIDFYQHEHAAEGQLVIAEWGEGRIVRLELNGARTPLVIQVPDICQADDNNDNNNDKSSLRLRRVYQPRALLYSPWGDLLFVDEQPACHRAAVFRLPFAVHVQALLSLHKSRQAHEWVAIPEQGSVGFLPKVVYQSLDVTQIGGMAHTPTFHSIVVSANIDDSVVLLSVPLVTEDEDDEEDIDIEQVKRSREVRQLINLTQHFPYTKKPGAVAVSQDGRVFVATEEGVVISDPVQAVILGTIQMDSFPTSLTLGEDGFLYIATVSSLYRMAIKDKPLQPPTTMVRRLPKKQ